MRNTIVAIALVLGGASWADAQIYEAVGTRAQGMGGAFVAVADDATASWWNPAGLATGKLFSLVIEHGTMEDPAKPPAGGTARRDTSTGFSVAFPALALSYYRLRISEIAPVFPTAGGPPDRQDLRSLAVGQYGMTVGESFGSHLVIGSTLKLLRAGTAESSVAGGVNLLDHAADLAVTGDTKTDLDLGAMAALGVARFGVNVKHLRAPSFGAGAARFEMARQARAGVAVLTEIRGPLLEAATASVDVDLTRTPTVNGDRRHVAAGVETWFAKRRLGLRSGVSVNTIGSKVATGSIGASVAGPSRLTLEAALLFGPDQARNGLNVAMSMTF